MKLIINPATGLLEPSPSVTGFLTKSQADTYYYPLSTNPSGYAPISTQNTWTADQTFNASLVAGQDIYLGSRTASPLPGWHWVRPITITWGGGLVANQVQRILFTGDVSLGTNALANGDDVRFFDADNSTPLSFERKYFYKSGGSAYGTFDVKIPGPVTTGRTIYMYYGNASATNGESTAAYSAWLRAHALKKQATVDSADYSGNNKPLTYSGNVGWDPSGFLYTDNSTHTGYTIVDCTGFNASSTFSLEIPFQYRGYTTGQTFLSFGNWAANVGDYIVLQVNSSNGNLEIVFTHNTTSVTDSIAYWPNYMNGNIQYLRLVKMAGTNTWDVYINGSRIGGSIHTSAMTTISTMHLGHAAFGSGWMPNAQLNWYGVFVKNSGNTNEAINDGFYTGRSSLGTPTYGTLTGWRPITGGMVANVAGLDIMTINSSGINLGDRVLQTSGNISAGNLYSSAGASPSTSIGYFATIDNVGHLVPLPSGDIYFRYNSGSGTGVTTMERFTSDHFNGYGIPFQKNGYLQTDLNTIQYDYNNNYFGVQATNLANPVQFLGGDIVSQASGSIYAQYYSIPLTPGGSEYVSFDYESGVSAPTNLTGGPNYGYGGYYAYSVQHIYNFWTINNAGHKSQYYSQLSFTDDGSSNNYYVNITMDSMPGASYYYVEHSTDGGLTWQWQNCGMNFTDYGWGSWNYGQQTFQIPYYNIETHYYRAYAKNGIAYSSNYDWSGTPSLGQDNGTYLSVYQDNSGSSWTASGQELQYWVYPYHDTGYGRVYNTTGQYYDFYFDLSYSSCRPFLSWDYASTPQYPSGYRIVRYDPSGSSGYYYAYQDIGGYYNNSYYDENSGWISTTGSGVTSDLFWYIPYFNCPSGTTEVYKQDSETGYTFDNYIYNSGTLGHDYKSSWTNTPRVQTGWFNNGHAWTISLYGALTKSGVTIESSAYNDFSFTDNGNSDSYYTIAGSISIPSDGNKFYAQLGGPASAYLTATSFSEFNGQIINGWASGSPSPSYRTIITPRFRIESNGDVYAGTNKIS